MLRGLLWGALAVSVVSSCGCGSKDDAATTQPHAVAGKVVDVKGSVKVGATALAKGDSIAADDVIETGPDSSIVIVLAHNDARWSLGPNRKVKATDSAAWSAERGTGQQVDQDTSAAGRPAERSAADTSTSARGVMSEDKKEAAPAPAAAAAAPPEVEAPARRAPKDQPAPKPEPPPVAAAAPAPQKAAIASPKAAAVHASPPPAPPPPPPPPPTVQAAEIGGAAPAPDSTWSSAMTKCVAPGGSVKLVVHVKAHSATITFVTKVDAKTKLCLTNAAKQVAKTAAAGDVSLELTP